MITPPQLRLFAATALTGLALTGATFAQAVQVDKELKPYQKTAGVTGTLNSIGSDTLNNLMTLWAEGFKAAYPSVNIQIEGKAPRRRRLL
jgi:phosphate transport system substrate-binding protein